MTAVLGIAPLFGILGAPIFVSLNIVILEFNELWVVCIGGDPPACMGWGHVSFNNM